MTRKALGRGLGALIPGAPEPGEVTAPVSVATASQEAIPGAGGAAPVAESGEGPGAGRVLEIPLDRISPNPKQPRLQFEEDALEELTESVRVQGVLQPVLVRPSGDRYVLIAGERRLRAAQRAGLRSIPAIVRTIEDDQLLEVALIENLQREDLNPIEEALAFQRLIDELNYTHERMSERVGKNRVTLTNSLRLLSLPAPVQSMVSRGTMSAGHARALLGLPTAAEIETCARYVVDMGFSVRKTEALVARKLRRKSTPRRARRTNANAQATVDAVSSSYAEWTDRLRRRLATQVRIVPGADPEKGQIEIEYYSETDLERLFELLGVMS